MGFCMEKLNKPFVFLSLSRVPGFLQISLSVGRRVEAAWCWLNLWISNTWWFQRQAIQIPIPKLLPLPIVISVNWSEIIYLYQPRKMSDIFCYPVVFGRSIIWLTLALSFRRAYFSNILSDEFQRLAHKLSDYFPWWYHSLV